MTDALSRRDYENQKIEKEGATPSAVTTNSPSWLSEVTTSYHGDPLIEGVTKELLIKKDVRPDYQLKARILRYKGRLVIGTSRELTEKLIQRCHDTAIEGHSGIRGTYECLKQHFFWPDMKENVVEFGAEMRDLP